MKEELDKGFWIDDSRSCNLATSVPTFFITLSLISSFILFFPASTRAETSAAGQEMFYEAIRAKAEQGDAEAQFNLGVMYANGRGVSQDDVEAVKWFRKVAEQGDAGAQHNLGSMYSNGRGVPKDDAEAARWFRKAAEQGDVNSQVLLGDMYSDGRGVPKDDAEASRWFRKAAEQGEAPAQRVLGGMYSDGRGVLQDDAEAVKWYRKAADQGDAAAQYNLGVMYGQGRGVPQDDADAVKWFRKATDQGDADAQYALGVMYAAGLGVPRDDKKADLWYRKAAKQGQKEAKEELKRLYADGLGGTEQDDEPEIPRDVVGPVIDIARPGVSGGRVVTGEYIQSIEGLVTDNAGVARLTLNGREVTIGRDGKFSTAVKLRIGSNPVTITAEDINDNTTKKEILIERVDQRTQPEIIKVDMPTRTAAPDPTKFAVVFGVERYTYVHSNASYAENDAEMVREYFIKVMGVPAKNIYFRTSEKATGTEFQKAFAPDGWLSRRVKPDKSTIYVYYSGHGAPDLETKSAYLIPSDADPNYARTTGYALSDLYANLSKMNPRAAYVFIDACFTGETGRTEKREVLLADARGATIVDRAQVPYERLTIMTACKNDEISSSYPAAEHGLFTYYLLLTMSGRADANSDGKVTVGEMRDYVVSSVSEKAVEMDRKQTPDAVRVSNPDEKFLEYSK